MTVPAAQIQTLRPKYRSMARLVTQGITNLELAERFGLSTVRISQIINSPLFKAEVERLIRLLKPISWTRLQSLTISRVGPSR